MRPRLLNKSKIYNPSDHKLLGREEAIEDLGFTVHKFSGRPYPEDKRKRMFISCFSEFGCETVGCLYTIPGFAQRQPGLYRIAMGWHGREYLYRHLVDEFWEIKKEHMWLREYCRAFNHTSLNLARLEESIKGKEGLMADSKYMARMVFTTQCLDCHQAWIDFPNGSKSCTHCAGSNLRLSIFGNIAETKKLARLPNTPSIDKMSFASSLLGKRPVGVFARGRVCYGRNLPPEFYVKLIADLERRGYTPIWLGEEATTQPCPVSHVTDFSRMPQARDMETTMAIVKQCEFTVQFWTASTRLAGMMGTPFLLIESPEQLWDGSDYLSPGQEGYRLLLTSFGPRKIAACTYDNFLADQEAGLGVVTRCIDEMERGDFSTVMGLLGDEESARCMMRDFRAKTKMEL
jgi:hypothetical protein